MISTVFSQVRHWVVVVVVEEEQEELYYKSIGVVVVVLLMGITMGFQVLGFPSSCMERSSHVFVFGTCLLDAPFGETGKP